MWMFSYEFDQECKKRGGSVVAGDHGHRGVILDFLVGQEGRAGFVAHAEQASDEILIIRDVLLPQFLSLFVYQLPYNSPGLQPRAYASVQARERQIYRHRQHSVHHLIEQMHQLFSPLSSLYPKQKRANHIKSQRLHQRHHLQKRQNR